MLRISYVINSGKIKVTPYFHIKKCVDTTNMGGRTYPVRYYPVAIRLRDRKGRAILCIALFPQSGDSSGAILGVRSVALLHVIDSGKTRDLITLFTFPLITLICTDLICYPWESVRSVGIPKLQLPNAGHTPVRSQYFQKIG